MSNPLDAEYPKLLLLALAVVTIGALFVAMSTSTASFSSYNSAWDGASKLQSEASATGADSKIVRKTAMYDDANPNGTVAVVLSPDTPYRPAERADVKEFVQNGGTLIVAEDFGPHSNPLLRSLGAKTRVDGQLVRDERYNYRSPAMPVARNVGNRSLTRGVERLTLNYGTVVRPHNATVLANTSEYAYLDANRNGNLDADETLATHPVAATERIGDGRVIIVSDPSLFVNAMLDRSGNRAFVRQIFEGHSTVLLDYSHANELPPLALAVLTLRTSPLLQIVVGACGIGMLALWVRRPELPRRLAEFRRNDVADSTPRVGEREMVAYVEKRHPEWDSERVERVVESLREKR
ncbi:DUF4350 domain-containing protein [Haladaptatus salinisoli]|uniref:DUF4350 domain-containing protein n=1 Tax=Haladaptatus salinisoli TaxID=2884876 RepID=UPI001D0B1E04|nr:DUF4350 domain-containing protein [Haladaptatus salinisoli]